MEEYIERFLYNLQKSKYTSLTSDIIRTIFLKGIQDEYLDVLNVMGKGDVSYLPFDEITELCQKYSRGRARKGKRDITSKTTKSATGSISRTEFGSLLEDFKADILSTLGTQVEVLKTKKRHEQQDQALSIFCPKCRKQHLLKECSLSNIHICGLCAENHKTMNPG